MAFDYTNLYPDTSGNGGYTKSWNYTTVVDNLAACSASGFFNKVASRLGIGDNIVVAQVDAFDKARTALLDHGVLFVATISGGVVTTIPVDVTKAYVDAGLALKADLASPALTGTPTAPTAAVDTNTTQLASAAFVIGQAAAATPLIDGTAAAGTSTRFARADHIHPTDTSRAPTASPTFTGTPAAPTAAVDTNTTQLATTAMVLAQAASVAPLAPGTAAVGTSTRFARQDHVHANTKNFTIQYFTASGTWTKPAGCTMIEVELVSAGGGSGGVDLTTAAQIAVSSPGGGGGYSRKRITNLANATETVTVAVGGTAGTAGNNAGGTGGVTSFGTSATAQYLQATGGTGGVGGAASASANAGNTTAGVGSSGDFNTTGYPGGPTSGIITGGVQTLNPSPGGGSLLGGGGSGTTGGVGIAGQGYGGGGGSSSNLISSGSTRAGAAGAAGIVIVKEFYGA